MRKKFLNLVLSFALITVLLPITVQAQDGECRDALPPRLVVGANGQVAFTDGSPLNVRDAAGLTANQIGQLPEGASFVVAEDPVCADGIYWWRIESMAAGGWVAEGADGEYFIEPYASTAPDVAFGTWDWNLYRSKYSYNDDVPDPFQIVPPPSYAGDMPTLPINLDEVQFAADAGLTPEQLALLAQNGFVVVPGGFKQFDEAYRDTETWWSFPLEWDGEIDTPGEMGHSCFVTTDAMLQVLHDIFDNLLADLENEAFYPTMLNEVLIPSPFGGWQLSRGGVFSYYEFVGNINQRMTDEEWRAQVDSGSLPPRPSWVSAFFSE